MSRGQAGGASGAGSAGRPGGAGGAGGAIALVCLVVLAGCIGGVPSLPDLPGFGDDEPANIGRECGITATQELAVTTDDGLNATEQQDVVCRTMARVEEIRGLEFTENVSVEVISRDEYQANRSGSNVTAENRWNDQVWEALFLVSEERTFQDEVGGVLGSQVLGYYSPSKGDIVLVSDSDTPLPDRATLAHELVHALQDQQLSLGGGEETQDTQLASDGLVEGDANYVENTYENYCDGRWSCIERPGRGGGGGGDFNRGVYLTIIQPYSSGPGFVDALYARGGWDAVDAAYDDFPASTEQVIHPDRYPDDEPVEVSVPDRSNDAWSRFDVDPVADTVGEASIYAMFTHNGVIQREGRERYNYDHPVSTGWGGDSLVPYYRGDPLDGDYGYVWRTEWDSADDARAFHEAYLDLLDAKGATERGGNVYVVGDGGYADAFRVTRDGTTVTVVNAPTPGDLEGVHGG